MQNTIGNVALVAILSAMCADGQGSRPASAPAPRTAARVAGPKTVKPDYSIAFANVGPLNVDIFLADQDGSNPRPIAPGPDHDYNASFSRDGRWIIFTSDRAGSADIYRVHLDGSGLERLTEDPAFDDQATLSADGKFLAFVSNRAGRANIWILDMDTRKLRNLTANHPGGDFRPSWSPDGQWIAFSSQRDSKRAKATLVPDNVIYIIRPDGSDLRRITEAEAFAGSPSWSQDSSRLVLYEGSIDEVRKIRDARGLRGTTQIVSIELKNNERHVLTSGQGEKWSPRYLPQDRIAYVSGGPDGGIEFSDGRAGVRGEFGSPDWSPDGRYMVFHRETDHNWPPLREWHSRDPKFRLIRTGVFPSYAPSGEQLAMVTGNGSSLHNGLTRMNKDGSGRSVLFDDPERNALAPAWSPKGDKIAFGMGIFFQGVFGGQMPAMPKPADIAVIQPDGSGLKVLTKGNGNYGFPSWSPDGRRIVVRALTAKGKGLSIIDVATGEVKALTTGFNDTIPAWSPTGDTIAFSSDRDGDFGDLHIYTIRTDGTGLKRLTDAPSHDAHCAWSPDGKWLVFSSGRGGYKDEPALHPHNAQQYGDLYVMRADGSDVRQLTDDQYEDGTATFIPMPKAGSRTSNNQRQ